MNVVFPSLNLVISLTFNFALIKLLRFVIICMYSTMMKRMNVSLSNELVVNWCDIDISIFALRGWNREIFQERNSRNDDQNLERGRRGGEEGGYFGTWMDSRTMDVNEIFGICETWCFRVDWIREWTWPFTVSSHASQRIYFPDI